MESAAAVENRQRRGFPPRLGKRSAFPTAPTARASWGLSTATNGYTLSASRERGPWGGMLLNSRGPMVLKTVRLVPYREDPFAVPARNGCVEGHGPERQLHRLGAAPPVPPPFFADCPDVACCLEDEVSPVRGPGSASRVRRAVPIGKQGVRVGAIGVRFPERGCAGLRVPDRVAQAS